MPWSDYPLRSLTLPQGAGVNDARIVIGPDVPAELNAWYVANRGSAVVAAILFYTTAASYYYEVDLQGAADEAFFGRGFVLNNTTVRELEYSVSTAGGTNPLYMNLGIAIDDFRLRLGKIGGTPGASTGVFISNGVPLTVESLFRWGDRSGVSGSYASTVSNEVDTSGTTTSNAYVSNLTGAAAVTIDFTAPPSGNVLVHWRATGAVTASFGAVSPQISIAGGGATVFAASDSRSIQFNATVQMGFGASSLLALTPNVDYTATLFHRCAAASTLTLLRRELIVAPAL